MTVVDEHRIVVLQCDECGEPHAGCRNVACALLSRPYAGENVVVPSQTKPEDFLREARRRVQEVGGDSEWTVTACLSGDSQWWEAREPRRPPIRAGSLDLLCAWVARRVERRG